jgi:hypothetical protein
MSRLLNGFPDELAEFMPGFVAIARNQLHHIGAI